MLFASVPGAIGVIVTEIVTVPPVAIVPSEQVMLELPVHVPWDALLPPAIVPGGTATVATAFVAATWPRFVKGLVNVTCEVAVTDAGVGVGVTFYAGHA